MAPEKTVLNGGKRYYFTIPMRIFNPAVCTNVNADNRKVSCVNTNPLCITTTCTKNRKELETIVQSVMEAKFRTDGPKVVDPRTCYNADGVYVQQACLTRFVAPADLTFVVDWGMSGWSGGRRRQRRMTPPAPRMITFTVAVGAGTEADARTVRTIYDSVPAITTLTSAFKAQFGQSSVSKIVQAAAAAKFTAFVGDVRDMEANRNRAKFTILDEEFGVTPDADDSMLYDKTGTPSKFGDLADNDVVKGSEVVKFAGTQLNADCNDLIKKVQGISSSKYFMMATLADLDVEQQANVQTLLLVDNLLEALANELDKLEEDLMVSSNQAFPSFTVVVGLQSERKQLRAAESKLTSGRAKMSLLVGREYDQAKTLLSNREKQKDATGEKDSVSVGLPVILVLILGACVTFFIVVHNRRSPRLERLTSSLIPNGAYDQLSLNGDTDA